MIVYLSVFSLSMFLIYIAQKQKDIIIFFACSSIAILLPCVIAALRSSSVGTDVMVYASPLYELASHADSFLHYFYSGGYSQWIYIRPADFEIAYVVLVWISAKVFNSFQVLLFLTELLVIVPIYISAVLFRKHNSVVMFMMVYYFLYYNTSLNLMRQSIACALVILAFAVYYNNHQRYVISFIIVVFACLFHTSALFAVVIFAVYFVFMKSADKRLTLCLLFIAGFILLYFIQIVIEILKILGLGEYATSYFGDAGITLQFNQIIVRLPILFGTIFLIRRKVNYPNAFFLSAMIIFSILCSQLVSIGSTNARIGLYFEMFSMFIPACISTSSSHKRRSVIFANCLCVLYCFSYWVLFSVVLNYNATLPYLFS